MVCEIPTLGDLLYVFLAACVLYVLLFFNRVSFFVRYLYDLLPPVHPFPREFESKCRIVRCLPARRGRKVGVCEKSWQLQRPSPSLIGKKYRSRIQKHPSPFVDHFFRTLLLAYLFLSREDAAGDTPSTELHVDIADRATAGNRF